MAEVFLGKMDADELRREQDAGDSRVVKRKWIKLGFSHQMSIYGALAIKDQDRHEGRRIEILSNQPYTEKIIYQVYEFFLSIPPIARYTIWIFNANQEGLRMVGRYD
jgi:hypothetical protein